MPQSQDAAAAALPDDIVERVLDVVRQLARETGGVRAARAVAAQASLERDVGLGSLERVELLARLERAFGRPLDDASLAVDTAAGLARAVIEAAPSEPLRLPAPAALQGGGARHRIRRPQPRATSLLAPRRARARARPRLPARRRARRRRARQLRPAVRRGRGRRGRPARARHRARATRSRSCCRPASTSCARSSASCCCARAGADLPAAAARPAGGVRAAPVRDPGRRRRQAAGHDRARAAGREPAPARRADAAAAWRPRTSSRRRGRASPRPTPSRADAAFIQYTSGSTGQPKGVLLTHANLLANIRAIASGLEMRPDDVGVSWLPLYHDMGLIGAWLICLHNGLPLTLLPPTAFLARPGALAVGDPRAARDPVGRPELRLRALRAPHRRRGDRGPRPLVVARRA